MVAGEIILAGLGPGDPSALPGAVLEELAAEGQIWLRTEIHPAVARLKGKGIKFNTFDIYTGLLLILSMCTARLLKI
jgi:tetrapyrrole methylase family protein/MazG family protein